MTVAAPEPPSALMVAEAGEMLMAQAMPDWVTLKVAKPPLTLMVPMR